MYHGQARVTNKLQQIDMPQNTRICHYKEPIGTQVMAVWLLNVLQHYCVNEWTRTQTGTLLNIYHSYQIQLPQLVPILHGSTRRVVCVLWRSHLSLVFNRWAVGSTFWQKALSTAQGFTDIARWIRVQWATFQRLFYSYSCWTHYLHIWKASLKTWQHQLKRAGKANILPFPSNYKDLVIVTVGDGSAMKVRQFPGSIPIQNYPCTVRVPSQGSGTKQDYE